jgi:hypothetical protein
MTVEEFEEIKKRHELDAFLWTLRGSTDPVLAAAYDAHEHRGKLINEVERINVILRNGMDTDWLDA